VSSLEAVPRTDAYMPTTLGDLKTLNKMLAVDEEIKKSNLRYTRLISFRVSRVSDAHLRAFTPEPTL